VEVAELGDALHLAREVGLSMEKKEWTEGRKKGEGKKGERRAGRKEGRKDGEGFKKGWPIDDESR
jgi:hypothetical protein